MPGIGTLQHNNQLFNDHPTALKLVVYNDDIEVGNPLGSKAGINKLTMYYFQLLNIENSSSLSNIHLVLIAYSSDVKSFGHSAVLRPFIEDLKSLEQGMDASNQNGSTKVFGSVVHLAADNLAANESQGFVASFSATYFCRFCTMAAQQTHRATVQDRALLRTTKTHIEHVDRSRVDPTTVSKTGVRSECVFEELVHFSPVDSFTPDLMHDVFHGVATRELSLLLTHCITSQTLSLSQINGIIQSFYYGYAYATY